MPRAERLSTRLDSLLEAIFEASLDPAALYWDIAAHIRSDQLAQAQKKIRKTLRQKGEIRSESAVLVACVLHLTGFPAHRILHFLSLYVPGGIRLSLFELAVSAIFLGETPIPTSLLYDLTQYTYLEKRLLARRSIEISEQLKALLNPGVLLYLYLLSLRDDLSNENIQLIALIMKNCFPDLEVRTRIGGASLEEYGEIARAWKLAEQRSLNLDIGTRTGAQRRGERAFDRDSASFFLDKYFSDTSLAEMRVSAPLPAARRAIRAPVERKKRAEGGEHVERKRETGAEVAAPPRIAPSAAQEARAPEARHRRPPRKAQPGEAVPAADGRHQRFPPKGRQYRVGLPSVGARHSCGGCGRYVAGVGAHGIQSWRRLPDGRSRPWGQGGTCWGHSVAGGTHCGTGRTRGNISRTCGVNGRACGITSDDDDLYRETRRQPLEDFYVRPPAKPGPQGMDGFSLKHAVHEQPQQPGSAAARQGPDDFRAGVAPRSRFAAVLHSHYLCRGGMTH